MRLGDGCLFELMAGEYSAHRLPFPIQAIRHDSQVLQGFPSA